MPYKLINYCKSLTLVSILSIVVSSQALAYDPKLADQCRSGLKIANAELEQADVDGFSGTVAWSKAAGLLLAANIQQQFDKFPNCINKVGRAREYIRQSKQK